MRTYKEIKKKLGIDDSTVASWFGFKTPVSFRNSSKSDVYKSGIEQLYEAALQPFTVFLVVEPFRSSVTGEASKRILGAEFSERDAKRLQKRLKRGTVEAHSIRERNIVDFLNSFV